MRRGGRRWVALGLSLALLAGACSGGGDDDDDDDQDRPSIEEGTTETDAAAVDGGSLVVGLASTPATFDPTTSALTTAGLTAALAVFDPLMAFDADGDVVPYLAESLEADDEHLVWTLVLRDGVTFSNGEPLSAAAVVRAFDGHLASELTRQALRDIESVGAVDRRTVELRMKRPWASFPSLLTGRLGLVPAPSMLDATDAAGPQEPIGTGPFVVDAWAHGSSVTLVRNPTYWRGDEGLPHLDRLELRAVPDPADRVAMLAAGAIDVMLTDEPAGIAALADLDAGRVGTALVDEGALTTYAIRFNTAAPPFDDLGCRRAIAAAIDREELADSVARGILLVPDGRGAEESGSNADCDFAYRTGSSGLDNEVSRVLRAMLDDAGITMTLQQSDASSVALDSLLGRFEAIGVFDEDLDDPDERSAAIDAANAAPIGALARNVSRFDDQEVQEALISRRAAREPAERARLDARIEELIVDRLPYLALFRTPWVYGFDATVGGIRRGLTLPGGGEARPRPGVLLAAELHTTTPP